MPDAEESRCFQPSKIKEFEVDFEGKWDAVAKSSGCSEQTREAEASRNFRYDCENFARIAKISLGLRKFRWDCENFATIAKISQS